jgi:aromatic ring-cleaving dioxygenase
MRKKVTSATGAALADVKSITHYHAHIYYDSALTRDRAARLRERVAETFSKATLGRWHDEAVGPHPRSMYQIAFPRALLASFLPWLMLNRDGLTILVHPKPAMISPITPTTPPGSVEPCGFGWAFFAGHRKRSAYAVASIALPCALCALTTCVPDAVKAPLRAKMRCVLRCARDTSNSDLRRRL